MAEPLPICYLNGEFQQLRDARVSPLDRAYLFGDSVYEVLPVFAGRMFRFREHFDRLARSLAEIRLPSPHTHAQWLALLEDLIRRNGGGDMYVYVQVTRGMEYGRNHNFPEKVTPGVFAMAAPLPVLSPEQRSNGLSAITVEDFRWARCDIKTTALLANVLMKQRAADEGAQEAIIVRDGEVLEGSSTSVFVIRNGAIATPPKSNRILPGTTRDVTVEIADGAMPVTVRRVGIDELRNADEVWISSATRDVLPVTRIDGRPVGTGKPGPLWQRMYESFDALRRRLAGTPAL
ncbi:MAG TPA: D-amino acid aminotransferase [Steroidobacteraceae bacterium]|nr:D-amino acid aminotransferase [Steroidobacteraceae bacterium]